MQATNAGILLRGYNVLNINAVITSVVTDSRQATKGSAFVCIRGERVDGHDYALKALENGTEIIVAERKIDEIPSERLVVVDNSLDAMIKIGENYRSLFSPVLVGVTGSVGKTTTKEFCGAVFSKFGETLKTEGNQNNEIGMPNTLLRITSDTKYAVIEMGMQGVGEIERLTLAARPIGAIITGIGCAHLEQLKSRENILKAKLEICAGIPDGGVLVTPYEDEFLSLAHIPHRINRFTFGFDKKADVCAINISQNGSETSFAILDKIHGSFSAKIPTIGRHNIMNALSAFTLATRLGLSPESSALALANFKTTGHRQNINKHNGINIIEDCYNANPDSMRAALSALRDYPSRRRIAVLGDMFELGSYEEQAHKDIGAFTAEIKADLVLTIGDAAQQISDTATLNGIASKHFKEKDELVAELLKYAKENDTILVKASHGMHFEEILQKLYGDK